MCKVSVQNPAVGPIVRGRFSRRPLCPRDTVSRRRPPMPQRVLFGTTPVNDKFRECIVNEQKWTNVASAFRRPRTPAREMGKHGANSFNASSPGRPGSNGGAPSPVACARRGKASSFLPERSFRAGHRLCAWLLCARLSPSVSFSVAVSSRNGTREMSPEPPPSPSWPRTSNG